MAPVFADTAYYLALLNPRDALHARSLEQSRALISPVLTTAWVVHELADGLSSPISRGAFLSFLETFRRLMTKKRIVLCQITGRIDRWAPLRLKENCCSGSSLCKSA